MRSTALMICGGLLAVMRSLCAAQGVEPPAAAAEAARQRVLATVRAAVASWPDARAALHEADAGEARAQAAGAAGSPFVAWTSEGVDDSFERSLNAQDALQLGLPFNLPGQSRAAGRYASLASEAAVLDRSTLGIHVAREVGALWVERAAWLERLAVHRARLARIDEALALHEARYQQGEVSGSEVMQLDLEHVRESSQLAATEAEALGRLDRLRELCGEGCEDPRPGDLELLAGATRTPSDAELSAEALESGALLRQARAAAAARKAQSELDGATAFGRPEAAVEWEHVPSVDGAPSYDAWGVALSVPLPVGRAGRQLRAAAEAEALASDELVEGARRALERRARVARTEADAAGTRLSALTTAVDGLERIESSLRQQFRLGVSSYLVHLDGLNRLDEVRLETIAAREQLLLARLELASILADPAVFPVPPSGEEEVP